MAVPQARLSSLIPYGFVNNKSAGYLSAERLRVLPTAPDIKRRSAVQRPDCAGAGAFLAASTKAAMSSPPRLASAPSLSLSMLSKIGSRLLPDKSDLSNIRRRIWPA